VANLPREMSGDFLLISEALEILVGLTLPQEELKSQNTAWLSKSETSQPSINGAEKQDVLCAFTGFV